MNTLLTTTTAISHQKDRMDDLAPLPTTFDPDNDDFDVDNGRDVGHGSGDGDEDDVDLLIVHGGEDEEEGQEEEENAGEGEGDGEDQTNLMEYIASLQQIGEHDNDANQDQSHDPETGHTLTQPYEHEAEVVLGPEGEEPEEQMVVDAKVDKERELGQSDRNQNSVPNPDSNPSPIPTARSTQLQSTQHGQGKEKEPNQMGIDIGRDEQMDVDMEGELGESIEVDPGQESGECESCLTFSHPPPVY